MRFEEVLPKLRVGALIRRTNWCWKEDDREIWWDLEIFKIGELSPEDILAKDWEWKEEKE